jgi:hypothetical protein
MTPSKSVDKARPPQQTLGPWGFHSLASPTFPGPDLWRERPRRHFSTVSTAPSTSTERKISSIESNSVENNPSKVVTQDHRIGGIE